MCSTGPFQYKWLKGYIYSSCHYHNQIKSIHLSHCYHIFFVVVCLICLLHHILSLIVYTFRETKNLFSLLLCSLWWVQIVGYVLHCRSYSFFVQYTISLSSLCKIIWRHWIYKMPVRYILSSVWVRLSIFSQLSIIQPIIQYVGLCVFSLPTPLVMIEKIYILCLIIIIIKSEVWTITYCWGLGHETIECAVCLSIFLWHGSCRIITSELQYQFTRGN